MGVLWSAHLSRIKRGLTLAAKVGHIYHLWWHPHNFGSETERNLRGLRSILDHYRSLKMSLGMRSLAMGEVEGGAKNTHG
jgi:hypothetical protein